MDPRESSMSAQENAPPGRDDCGESSLCADRGDDATRTGIGLGAKSALDGGADGLRLIEPCIQQAAGVLVGGGVLLLEIGADQSKKVVQLLNQENAWEDIRVFRDLAGLPRIVQSRKSGP